MTSTSPENVKPREYWIRKYKPANRSYYIASESSDHVWPDMPTFCDKSNLVHVIEMSAFQLLEVRIRELEAENESLSALVGTEFHACRTGDCPHEKQTECDAELAKIDKRHGFCPFVVTGNGFSKQFITPMKVIDFRAVQAANAINTDQAALIAELTRKLSMAVETAKELDMHTVHLRAGRGCKLNHDFSSCDCGLTALRDQLRELDKPEVG